MARRPRAALPLAAGVVWFGESLDPDDLSHAEEVSACDVFLVAGTSSVVYPAAGFASLAHAQGAFVIEINPEATPVSGTVDVSLRAAAENALDQLNERLTRPS